MNHRNEQAEQRLQLVVGEQQVLRLPARGSAGYDWWEEIEGAGDIVEVRRGSAATTPATASRKPTTQSFDTLIHLRGIKPGNAIVTLAYKRPPDPAPLKSIRIAVQVVSGQGQPESPAD